jgi:hypothetical protein
MEILQHLHQVTHELLQLSQALLRLLYLALATPTSLERTHITLVDKMLLRFLQQSLVLQQLPQGQVL